ncbi:MAG: GFA family protein [Pseudomonadota bacterium]
MTWETSAAPLWAGHCHCNSCRRATAAPFTSFLGVPTESVAWSGQMDAQHSSDGAVTRRFCTKCGTQMSYQSRAWPDETHLYAATMDQPEQFRPEAHFHYGERLDWIELTDDLPKYPRSADGSDPL